MANLRVLLADSDISFRTTAQRALTRQGYLVIPVANGIDALTFLGADEIDVVVADVGLPEHDGLEVLRAAKSKTPPIPVILMAEPGTVGSAEKGVGEGASDYLVKPVDDLALLVGLVEQTIGEPVPSPSSAVVEKETAQAVTGEAATTRLLNAATSGQELTQFLELYAKEIAQLVRAQQGLVLLAHSDGQLHVAAALGFADRAEAGRVFVRTGGEEFAYRVASGRDIVDQAESVTPLGSGDPGGQILLGLPLLYAQVALGVAVIFSSGPRETMPPSALAEMRRLTQQASLAVELSRVRGLADHRNPIDPVTGLLNREHFFGLADREFRRSWRFGERIAALQLDVDDFAKLHLLLGPNEADEIMRHVARSVHTHVRNIDIVGRLDADKLGVLLLNAARDVGASVAERLRRSVAEIELPTSEGPWQVTASVGVAIYPREQCSSVHDLFGLAAQAARTAKRAGRNRVVGV